MKMIGVKIQQADVPNKNNRVYTRAILEQVVEEYNDGKPVLGTIGMEDNRAAIAHSSHKVENLRIEDGYLVGDVTVLQTETGNALTSMLEAYPLDFRMDGIGSVVQQDGNNVVTDYTLTRVNAVLDGA
jgi:hypothetical protein